MSQITRCPSCATSFKVVADQLRISEGWVRCGQCKEVFDASAHLLPSAPPSLLPGVSLTEARPPSTPIARSAGTERAWGAPPATSRTAIGPSAPAPGPAPVSAPATVSGLDTPLRSTQSSAFRPSDVAAPASVPTAVPSATPAAPVSAAALGVQLPDAPPLPVMDVPTPAVPAFLTVNAPGASDGGLGLDPIADLAWRPSPPPPSATASNKGVSHAVPSYAPASAAPTPAPLPPLSLPPLGDVPAAVFADTTPASLDDLALPLSAGGSVSGVLSPQSQQVPGGYELPFAELRDSEWPADVELAADRAGGGVSESGGLSFPALDAPPAPTVAAPDGNERFPSIAVPAANAGRSGAAPAAEGAKAHLPPVDHSPSKSIKSPEALALVEDDSVAAVLRADTRKLPAVPDVAADTGNEHGDVSFVRAARRKAFWRQPGVRVVLALLALTALVVLALQVAVQERDLIAATDSRTRPWLAKLCAPLKCAIAAPRQISDVVIDSSSFNKARGDSYQLALTIKNQSSIPLAMPAVELTLTDVQDQPVLRRVLLPTDMAAPGELPARGEWSASVAVIVTTGGARVAGYRLLAFYP